MTEINSIIKTIKQAKQVAIVLPKELTLDVYCASVALTELINKSGISASIFSSSVSAPATPFLKNSIGLTNSFSKGDQLVIKVSNKNTEAKEIRYEKDSDGLSIFVTANNGQFKDIDVSVLPNMGVFDLVVILGAANLESLGELYTKNTKLFFGTPTINIDVNPNNEYFSKLNLIEPTVSSLCELIYDIAVKFDVDLTENINTSLLAGIISETASFRDPKTTPAALQKSSDLISKGARQQDIIQYLFKTKSLQQLQLWGRALARITEFPDKKVITAVLTKNDLEKTGDNTELLPLVLKDLIEMVTGYSLIILLVEETRLLIAGLPHENISSIVKEITGQNFVEPQSHLVAQYEYLSLPLSNSLAEVQEKVNTIIKNK